MFKLAIFSERKTEVVYWDEVLAKYADKAEAVIRTAAPMSAELLEAVEGTIDGVIILPSQVTDAALVKVLEAKGVQVISMRSVGLDTIDLDAAAAAGIGITNVPAYSPQAMAEYAVYYMLAGLRNMKASADASDRGAFNQAKLIGHQLNTRTVGILGYGHIGQKLAELLGGFGTKVIAYIKDMSKAPEHQPDYVSYATDMDAFLGAIDVLSLHIPLTDESKHIVNADFLAKMRPGSVVVNTARGGLVDTQAILAALDSGHIHFYGTDVYEHEAAFFNTDYPSVDAIGDPLLEGLLRHPQVMLTPHTAFNSYTSVENMVKFGTDNAINYLTEAKNK